MSRLPLTRFAPAAEKLGVVEGVLSASGTGADAVDFEEVDGERGSAIGAGAEGVRDWIVISGYRLALKQGGL